MPDHSYINNLSGELLPKYITKFSLLIITATFIAVIFRFDMLRKLCVCISNFLAYSWLAFGIAVITGIISFNLLLFARMKNKPSPANCLIVLNLLQSLAFITGMVFLFFFGALLINVI